MSDASRRAPTPLLCACALGAAGVSWTRATLTGSLALYGHASVSTQLLVDIPLGLLLALAALAYLRLELERIPLERLLVPALLLSTCAALALPLTSNDLFSNLAYARLAGEGHNPYLVGPSALGQADPFAALVDPRWRDTPIVYGPVATAVDWAVGVMHLGVPGSMLVFKALMLAATLGTVLLAYDHARRLGGAAGTDAFVLVALCPALVWELSAQAHNDVIMVLGLAAFVVLATRGREAPAVVCLALAIFTKMAAAPVLVFYLAMIWRRSRTRALLLGTLAVAMGAILMAPFWHGWSTLRAPLQTVGGDAGRTTRSFADLLYWAAWLIGPAAQRAVYGVCWIAGTVLLAVIAVVALRRVRVLDDVVRGSLVLFLAYDLVGAPWFQPWYVTWLLPLAMADRDARWRRVVAVYAAITPVQYLLPIDPVNTVAIDLYVLWRVAPLAWAGWMRSPGTAGISTA